MRRHHITGMHLEDGHGAHPEHVQAARHCDTIEALGNKALADKYRKELGIPTDEDRAEAAAKAAKEAEAKAAAQAKAHQNLHDRIAALEIKVEELFGLHLKAKADGKPVQ